MMNGKNQVKLGMMMFLATAAVLVVHAQTGAASGSAAPQAGKSLID